MYVCMYVRLYVSIKCFFSYKSQINGWILMIFTYKIDINETKSWPMVKVTQSKVRSNMQFCQTLVSTIYHEPIIEYHWLWLTWLLSMRCWSWPNVKVKGQGQICKFVKILFWLCIMNERLDIDDTYTHDKW